MDDRSLSEEERHVAPGRALVFGNMSDDGRPARQLNDIQGRVSQLLHQEVARPSLTPDDPYMGHAIADATHEVRSLGNGVVLYWLEQVADSV